MARLNALWWWIDRWRKSTAYTDMTLEEQGAYRNLLDEAHLRGGALPNDERILAKACGDALAWSRVRGPVLARFELRPDGWHNGTLDRVLAQSIVRADRQARYRERNEQRNAGHNTANNNTRSPSPSPSLQKIKSVSPEAAQPPSEPAVLAFPVVGSKDCHEWSLTQSQLDEWGPLYPGLDVLATCRNALAWARANPTKRKTAKGMPRFLVNWLTREQNQGRPRANGPPAVDPVLAKRAADLKRIYG